MRTYINRLPVNGPWGGGNLFVSAFHKRAPGIGKDRGIELVVDPTGTTPLDVILLAGLDNDGSGISIDQAVMYKMYAKPDVQIVLRVNENDVRKGTSHMDDMLVKVSEHIDATVFVSHWLQDYFNDLGWKCPNQTVIYNGVARDVFAPQPKLNNGKINIVAHHWSDNRMKGADVYEQIDKLVGEYPGKFGFTYIGRHQCDFKNTTVVKPLAGKALGQELGKHDVYVSASRGDPGPNHVLEALSCDLPTWVHREGGGCVEFAGRDHAYDNWDQLQSILMDQGGNTYGAHLPNGSAIQLRTWQECIQEYIDFLEATWKAASGSQSS